MKRGRKSLRMGAVLLWCVASSACTGPRPAEKVENRSDTGAHKAEEPNGDASLAERWSCGADEDCTQTCALGAVSVSWLKANPDADTCDDGCYWNQNVGCREGFCATLTESGEIDPDCTKRKTPKF